MSESYPCLSEFLSQKTPVYSGCWDPLAYAIDLLFAPKKSKFVPCLSPLVARRTGDFEVMECSLTIADRLWIGCMKIQECGCITPFRHKWIGMACSMQDSTPICRLIKCAGHIIYVKFKNISSADFVTKLERIIQWNFVTILILSTNVFA